MIVLFVGNVKGSAGELQHAVSFARQLSGTEFIPVFLFKYPFENYFHGFSFFHYYSEQTKEFEDIIRKLKPVLIICCEYHNLPNNFCNLLLTIDTPVASMDGTGFFAVNLSLEANRDYPKPEKMTLLQPCPVNVPEVNTENIKYWNLFPGIENTISEKELLKNFDWKDGEKLIFFSIAGWAYNYSLEYDKSYYYGYLFDLLFELLSRLPYKVNFVIISPLPKYVKKQDNLTVYFLNTMKNDLYDQLLMNSDLIISDNIVQASISKAFAAGKSTLCLVNSSDVQEPFELHKFNMFPLPYRDELFPENNLYYQSVPVADIFNRQEVKEKISALLAKQTDTAAAFREKCRGLLPVPEIVRGIIKSY